MKLILKESVPKLGEIGDVVTVKDGYGRNYLIPQGKARLVTRGARAELEHHKRVLERKRNKLQLHSERLASQLAKVTLHVEKTVGGEGRIFGSVTTAELAEQLAELDFAINRRDIKLLSEVKKVGDYEAEVSLPAGVKGRLRVVVRGLEQPAEEEVSSGEDDISSAEPGDSEVEDSPFATTG